MRGASTVCRIWRDVHVQVACGRGAPQPSVGLPLLSPSPPCALPLAHTQSLPLMQGDVPCSAGRHGGTHRLHWVGRLHPRCWRVLTLLWGGGRGQCGVHGRVSCVHRVCAGGCIRLPPKYLTSHRRAHSPLPPDVSAAGGAEAVARERSSGGAETIVETGGQDPHACRLHRVR